MLLILTLLLLLLQTIGTFIADYTLTIVSSSVFGAGALIALLVLLQFIRCA